MNCDDLDDVQLVNKIITDHKYFRCLIEAFEKKLRRYIYRQSGRSQGEIDEVLQETYIKVFRNLADYNSTLKLQNWVFRIARNASIDMFRKERNHSKNAVYSDSEDMTQKGLGFMSSIIDDSRKFFSDEKIKKIERIINALPSDLREVSILRFWEEKEYDEISYILQKPTGTIGSLVNRARKKIKQKYSEENGNES
jgi:RNA polymerase sigma-70 factor (ECF subfamily)